MRFAASCTFAAASLLSIEARAQAQPVVLSWEAPPECPSGDSVVAAVRRLVRAVPETPLRAHARVTQARNRWTADLETPSGRRTIDAENCVVLADTVAVILAIAVDPSAVNSAPDTRAGDRKPEDSGAAATTSARPPDTAESSRKDARQKTSERAPAPGAYPGAGSARDDRWSIGLSLRALLELGILPGPGFGTTVALHVERGFWGAELGVSLLLPQEGELSDDSTRGGTLSWFAGHALGCVAPTSVRWDVCAGLELGRMSGTGFGVDVPRTGHAFWFGPLVMTGVRHPLGASLSLEGRLGLALPLPRPPPFGLDGFGDVHRPAVVSGRAELGIRWK